MTARRVGAAIAEEALAAVFGATAVASLREDSPLTAVGLAPDDLVCLADAVSAAAARRGLACALDDAALDSLSTVDDLVDAIASHAREEAS